MTEHAAGRILVAMIATLGLVAGCGGGGSGAGAERAAQQGGGAVPTTDTDTTAATSCDGSCGDTPTFLTAADVEQVIAQVVAEAQARNVPGTVAVVDRVGNVLAVFRMTGASEFVTITSSADGSAPVAGGLEGVNIIPATMAAIAKAITGAYLSTEGNAFTTRTASQIVQENFNPGEASTPSGPLFGVQFSQLPCGDFVQRFEAGSPPGPGPHRSPLGLSADPGGLPLYKRGTNVGGVGFIGDGIYGLDKRILGFDQDLDEIAALAGTVGFAPPPDRLGDSITVVGKTFRYTDWGVFELLTDAATVTSFDDLVAAGDGALQRVIGYYDGLAALTGVPFGHPASGIRPAATGAFVDADGNDLDAFVFVDGTDTNRFPPRSGTDTPGGDAANALTAQEVRVLLANAIAIANRARAQIRRPLGTPARVTVSVVDSEGAILGMARTRDGPVFGADVSLQKARTATFFSGTGRVGGQSPADVLRGLPPPIYLAPADLDTFRDNTIPDLDVLVAPAPTIGGYVDAVQTFLGVPDALEASGPAAAFADRSGGNLSRPTFPDGVAGGPPGPLSKPPGEWSVFSVGLQLDLVFNSLIQHVAFVLDLVPNVVVDVGTTCTGNTGFDGLDNLFRGQNPAASLANGIQIFPGSVPIYRGDVLIGGIGVSGDGVDQDDMISLLGTHNAGVALGGAINNAPPAIRADQIVIPGQGVRLRYVSCPQAPFIDTNEDNVCDNK
ncbi:MAG TPA: heme-binding protein [Pseudomonadales bacterium]|nr:heme-binding protein [Pseudomonadales bacterium]